jgi:hypothetical protein
MFKLICIDTMRQDDLIKQGINNVPTIVVINQNGSDTRKDIFDGENAFHWVEKFINCRREFIMHQAEENRRIIQLNNKKTEEGNALKVFPTMETAGISDAYAYYHKDLETDVKLDIPQPKAFLPYGKDQDYNIVTFQDSKTKINSSEQRKKEEEIKNLRSNQDKELSKIFEQQQISSVINANFNI